MHAGGIIIHFGRDKIIILVEDEFYWPNIKPNVARVVSHYRVYQVAEKYRFLHTITHILCTLEVSQYRFHLRSSTYT